MSSRSNIVSQKVIDIIINMYKFLYGARSMDYIYSSEYRTIENRISMSMIFEYDNFMTINERNINSIIIIFYGNTESDVTSLIERIKEIYKEDIQHLGIIYCYKYEYPQTIPVYASPLYIRVLTDTHILLSANRHILAPRIYNLTRPMDKVKLCNVDIDKTLLDKLDTSKFVVKSSTDPMFINTNVLPGDYVLLITHSLNKKTETPFKLMICYVR